MRDARAASAHPTVCFGVYRQLPVGLYLRMLERQKSTDRNLCFCFMAATRKNGYTYCRFVGWAFVAHAFSGCLWMREVGSKCPPYGL